MKKLFSLILLCTTALYSFAAGLIANGLADIGWVHGALEAIKARIPTDR